ncbi:unnamed protein product (macronuclear) [Paramecium tetraurelia]|uniref:TPX2 central domain-containing protein n=1 Tax=Paramecium tetraurelia TaxID=5888 RepID=A0CZN3_PARTE|nr:uncharacterized protein GSPATT00011823001 [Paramecium tetraurelia]CAK76250.1 unnamed protein product [Paramecium tetraurelia]|eukprot:XP_001443647.1 hypothetical protein (macronuclear) [Paramecium tetraurelia strain d4-2]
MKNISSIVDYPPFEFTGKRIPIKALICNELSFPKETKPIQNFLIFSNQSGLKRSKSTPPSLRELLTDAFTITLTERTLPSKRISILLPFKNAVEKIRSNNREIMARRKSCYGSLFGINQQKQMVNYPTSIEMHKKINGKEFALSSFAELLKKNQRKSTKRPSLARKLSKQMSLVEYDNMERPPTCKTPRETKIILFKKKNSSTLTKEKYIQGQKLKLFHFMNDSQSRKIQLNSMPFRNSIKHRGDTMKLKTCMTELLSTQRSPTSSYRTTTYERPYQKQNELLSKLIKTEHKSRSHYLPKSTFNAFGY